MFARTPALLLRAAAVSAALAIAGCGGGDGIMEPPVAPTPQPSAPTVTASAYILPGATNFGAIAFGDEPVIIHKGERLRFVNADTTAHDVVTDNGSFPEFMTTGLLAPGAEQSFTMQTPGTTTIHCTIHPQMTGTLIVREP